LSIKAREAWQRNDLKTAEALLLEAWRVIPMPQTDFDYSQILSRGIVTFFRDTRQFEKAIAWLDTVRAAYGSTDSEIDPSVELLAGSVLLASGNKPKAYKIFDWLFKEYGERPFEGRPDCLEFYKQEVIARKGK